MDKLPNEVDTGFDDSKVFTSPSSAELKTHSIGYFANTISELHRLVESRASSQLLELATKDKNFFTAKNGRSYIFFYLVEESKDNSFRPYKDTDEMINHFCSHFDLVSSTYSLPHIWVKGKPESNYKDEIAQAVGFYKDNVTIGRSCNAKDKFTLYTLHELFDYFTYLDGTPCGIKK